MNDRARQARFEDLLDQHRAIVFKVANTYCRNAEDRRDLAQEIRAQLWRAFPRYDESRPFSTWMYRIALNVAISSARRAGLRTMATLDAADDLAGPPALEADERIDALRRIIDRLGDLDRALLLLYLDERSYREIADVLGIRETNVATRLSRLKQQIRGKFSQNHPESR